MGPLQDVVTWYNIRHTGTQKNLRASKTKLTKQSLIFLCFTFPSGAFASQYVILSCKVPILPTWRFWIYVIKSNNLVKSLLNWCDFFKNWSEFSFHQASFKEVFWSPVKDIFKCANLLACLERLTCIDVNACRFNGTVNTQKLSILSQNISISKHINFIFMNYRPLVNL